jgi:hypothetical protein
VVALLSTFFHTGFLLGLFFNPEDGGDMFLRNVGWLSTDYTARYIPEDRTLHEHRCENLKSHIHKPVQLQVCVGFEGSVRRLSYGMLRRVVWQVERNMLLPKRR